MGVSVGVVVSEMKTVGATLGGPLGTTVGTLMGVLDGAKLGCFDGSTVVSVATGNNVGIADGTEVGGFDGEEVVGAITGEAVGNVLVGFVTVGDEDGSEVDCGQKRVSGGTPSIRALVSSASLNPAKITLLISVASSFSNVRYTIAVTDMQFTAGSAAEMHSSLVTLVMTTGLSAV